MKNFLFMLTGILLWVLSSCTQPKTDGADANATAGTDTTQTAAPVAFADPKYSEIGRKMFTALSAGNVDEYANAFADNATFRWNNGDSLVGKQAIHDFWTARLKENIQSLSFDEHIFLPVNVNQAQAEESTGVWLLSWYRVDATYKTGKSMTQWMHMVMHFDENDKIDEVLQYRDNALIVAANTK